jgi:leader peptidase (prepilin peptidase)/N-methyltransferase
MGWQMLPLILLLSAVVGAAIGILLIALRRQGREVPIPFGPYLAGAGWIAMLWGPAIVDRYLVAAHLG